MLERDQVDSLLCGSTLKADGSVSASRPGWVSHVGRLVVFCQGVDPPGGWGAGLGPSHTGACSGGTAVILTAQRMELRLGEARS